MNCQVVGFQCPEVDLCGHCHGDGEQRPEELCQHCDRCFDDVVGWSTGIEPGTESAQQMRAFVEISGAENGE